MADMSSRSNKAARRLMVGEGIQSDKGEGDSTFVKSVWQSDSFRGRMLVILPLQDFKNIGFLCFLVLQTQEGGAAPHSLMAVLPTRNKRKAWRFRSNKGDHCDFFIGSIRFLLIASVSMRTCETPPMD